MDLPNIEANDSPSPAAPESAVAASVKSKKSRVGLLKGKKSESPLKAAQTKAFFRKNKFVFLSFVIPLILMTYAFICAGLYPFGDNQIMVIDMWHQFFQFFKLLHEKLQSFGSLLYTWNGGLGTNFIALLSYYAASPINLLSVFVPTAYLTEALAVIVVLKIALSGAFMCVYLQYMYRKADFGTAAFSILYALSAFAMGYYWCVMWLDVMALLPLCLLGLNRLIDKGKFKLYVLSLAMMLITNYYIAIMMCIFIALYYFVLYFSRVKERGTKYFFTVSFKALFFSALAACIAAVILIPTYFSMQNTYYIKPSFPSADTFYNPILDVISNLLPNVALTYRGGLPNIYCGLISFMLGVLFVLCKKIPARQRVLNCAILAFLILSFNWNKLDYIWHCLHFPNELPYRYSFTFSFILITMAYQAYLHLDDITPAQIGGVAAGGFIYLIVAEKLYSETFDHTVIYVSIGLLAAYALILAMHKSGKYKEALTGILLFIVVFGEMTNYTISSVRTVGTSSRSGYYTNYDDITALIGEAESRDSGFWRMELNNSWTTNDPALYGYRGVSQFSSEINANVTALMESIGLAADPGSNRFGYSLTTPIINSMLNVKYIIGRGSSAEDFALGEPLLQKGNSYLYENAYPLSIGYMANSAVKGWLNDATDPFEVQSNFVKYATGLNEDLFIPLTDPLVTGSGVITENFSGTHLPVSPEDGAESASVSLKFTADRDMPVYAYVTAQGASSINAKTDSGISTDFEVKRGSANSLGYLKAGESVTVSIKYEKDAAGSVECCIYGLDVSAWEAAYSKLAANMLEVTDFSDTKIKGTITADADGVFMTSVPYEKGWTVKVDSKKVEAYGIRDALLACDLPAGTHEIELSYRPYGFYTALTVSVSSLILLFVIDYLLKRLKKRRPDSILVAVPNDNGIFTDLPACDFEEDEREEAPTSAEIAVEESIKQVFRIVDGAEQSGPDDAPPKSDHNVSSEKSGAVPPDSETAAPYDEDGDTII